MKNRIFAVIHSNVHHEQLGKLKEMSKGELALAILKSKPARMGEIVEISQEGLSFQHVENDADITKFSEMDILYTDDDFHLSRLPIKAVKETAVEADVPFDVLSMTKLTVKFKGLTRKQKGQLNHLLENYVSPKKTTRTSAMAKA
jgi:hypothetical protein